MIKPLILLIDFDGTSLSHEFPNLGKDIGAVPILKELVAAGHRLILYTIRCNSAKGNYLDDAVNWFKENDIPLYGINENPDQYTWSSSRKIYGHYCIDDNSIVNSDKLEFNFLFQKQILKYRVDAFIDEIDCFGNKECTIIEYDEEHHRFQKEKDKFRVKEIVNNLFENNYKLVRIFRIRSENHNSALKYLIPYFYLISSYALDLAVENNIIHVEYYDNENYK